MLFDMYSKSMERNDDFKRQTYSFRSYERMVLLLKSIGSFSESYNVNFQKLGEVDN